MQKLSIYLVFMLLATISVAGNGNNDNKAEKNNKTANTKLISGKVVDFSTKEELAGVEIIIGDKKIYTDLSGNFSVVIPTNLNEIQTKYISYKDCKVLFDPFSYNPLVIEISNQ